MQNQQHVANITMEACDKLIGNYSKAHSTNNYLRLFPFKNHLSFIRPFFEA